MNRTPLLVTIVFIVLAGCLGGFSGLHGEPGWSLKVYTADETPHPDGIDLDIRLTFSGNPDEGARVESVRVCALEDNGTVLDQSVVGTITYDTYTTNTTLITPQEPSMITLDYSSVDTEHEFSPRGLERGEDGLYGPLYQDGPQCGNFATEFVDVFSDR